MEYKNKKFPAFVPSDHKNCKGHQIHMLDHDYADQESRDVFVQILDREINQLEHGNVK